MKIVGLGSVLVVLTAVVATLLAIWAWDEFKVWRINRQYGPKSRRCPNPGRLARRSLGEGGRSTD